MPFRNELDTWDGLWYTLLYKCISEQLGSGVVAVKAGFRESGEGVNPISAQMVNGPGSCPPNIPPAQLAGSVVRTGSATVTRAEGIVWSWFKDRTCIE
jgi:hypothetical protein